MTFALVFKVLFTVAIAAWSASMFIPSRMVVWWKSALAVSAAFMVAILLAAVWMLP